MSTRTNRPRVALTNIEYIALKIAFNPGQNARWYINHLHEYAGVGAGAGCSDYSFIGSQLIEFSTAHAIGHARIALEVPTSCIKREHLKGVVSSDNVRGYVITEEGYKIARRAADIIGIDPNTIPS